LRPTKYLHSFWARFFPGLKKKPFKLTGRPAGLEILFDVIDGRVLLAMLPNQQLENLTNYTKTMAENLTLQREDRLAILARPAQPASSALVEEDDSGQETDEESDEEEEAATACSSNPFAALM